MRIIHTADIHIGSKMQTHLSREKAKERMREISDSFARMVAYAKREGVSAILLAGDVFDSDCPTVREKDFFYDTVREASDIEFYYLRGNHDNRTQSEEDVSNLHRFGESWTSYEQEDVCITGIELKDSNASSLHATLSLDPAKKNIVMLHAGIGSTPDVQTLRLASFENKGIDYLALGHIHSHEIGRLDTRATYAYSGCLEGRGFDEMGEKGFLLLDTEEGFTPRFVPFAKRTVHEITVDVSTCTGVPQVIAMLDGMLMGMESDLARVYLIGAVDFEQEGMRERIESALSCRVYCLSVKDKTHRRVDLDALENELSLRGEFIRRVRQSDGYSDEEKDKIIELGLRALRGEELSV